MFNLPWQKSRGSKSSPSTGLSDLHVASSVSTLPTQSSGRPNSSRSVTTTCSSCGSSVSLPPQLRSFLCSTCECIKDLRSTSVRGGELQPVSCELLEKWIETPQSLCKNLFESFSSPSCLNASFHLPNVKLHSISTSHGLDLDEIDVFFQQVWSLGPEPQLAVLRGALKLLRRPRMLLDKPEKLRFLVVLMAIPTLQNVGLLNRGLSEQMKEQREGKRIRAERRAEGPRRPSGDVPRASLEGRPRVASDSDPKPRPRKEEPGKESKGVLSANKGNIPVDVPAPRRKPEGSFGVADRRASVGNAIPGAALPGSVGSAGSAGSRDRSRGSGRSREAARDIPGSADGGARRVSSSGSRPTPPATPPIGDLPPPHHVRSDSCSRPMGPPPPTSSIPYLSYCILSHLIGYQAHTGAELNKNIVNWYLRFSSDRFALVVDMVNSFISSRLTYLYRHLSDGDDDEGTGGGGGTGGSSGGRIWSRERGPAATPGSLPKAGGLTRTSSKSRRNQRKIRIYDYCNDWQITAAARFMSVLFNVNFVSAHLPTSQFYNTMVDFVDVCGDFGAWQSRDGTNLNADMLSNGSLFGGSDTSPDATKFTFCAFPCLLSLGAKTSVLEYDAKKQMEFKAREAFFDSLSQRQHIEPYLKIKVKRETLLADSLSEIERNNGNYKKSLRVEFVGEPGIDVGGIRKEWFLLLKTALFNPARNLFVEDDESHYCWFNPGCKASDSDLREYRLAGIITGLALYNSSMLDLPLPPVVFKKLLGCPVGLEDFTVVNPTVGKSLSQLLTFSESEVESLNLSYNVIIDSEGRKQSRDLISNGSHVAVTTRNRRDYVSRLVKFFLESSIATTFAEYKKGFHSVVGGNALSLFRPEELEALVKGSSEPLDIGTLKTVTRYQNFASEDPESELVVRWFWKWAENLEVEKQKKLLRFITGSDRIPATGISNMNFKITFSGPDCDRFPVSHTCFNELCVYGYSSRQKFVDKMVMAMNESEGFGIR
ncbi:putative E3 ubiquitin-protein ligase HUL4 [Yarrowia sp. B02]|nr:putative E3 ubiquitin-protein ligase HUL4 [Yarrowia sp. B02]